MEPLLIIGMYKSGTSWLLACLSAHPHCIGFREVDFIRAFGAFKRSVFLKKTFRHHEPAGRVKTVFGNSAWCHLPGSFYPDLVEAVGQAGQTLADLPARTVVERITGHVVAQRSGVRQSDHHAVPHNFLFLSQERLEALYQALWQAGDVNTLIDQLFAVTEAEIRERGLHDVRYYTFKGADQLSFIDALDDADKPVKKLVIIRDGRDAAISAVKFLKLMRKRQAAWTPADESMDYFFFLKSWAAQIATVKARMHDASYYVLRYEDLNLNFHETYAQLLDWLGLDAAPTLIDAVHSQTSFEAVTGRKRGEEKEAVIRKGVVREWVDALSAEEQKRAWKIAGKQLRAFGYPES